MTTWDGGAGGKETRFRAMAAREAVRRVRNGVTRQELNYVWLLGAGCSVSSGIPAAGDIARSWLKDLKYLETGQEADVDAWAARRMVGYDPDDPAGVYAEVFHAYLHTEHDRHREIERLMKSAEPGFGYATLAQLMTHEKWGARVSAAISVNFDDLAADALHLYSQRRPQVFTHESLNRRTPISPMAPTIVKIHGDAHLPRSEQMGNRPQLNVEVRERLRELIADAGLIVVGYGGRDASVLDMLEGLPTNAPTGGVYWINEHPPRGAFGDWMESRNGVWVKQSDFDELMYFIRLEFGLGHPKIARLEQILRRYESQYRELSTRAGLDLSATPFQAQVGGDSGLSLRSPGAMSSRRETAESRRDRLRQSLDAFTKVVKATSAAEDGAPRARPGRRALSEHDLLDACMYQLGAGPDDDDDAYGGRRPSGGRGGSGATSRRAGAMSGGENDFVDPDGHRRAAERGARIEQAASSKNLPTVSLEDVLEQLNDPAGMQIPESEREETSRDDAFDEHRERVKRRAKQFLTEAIEDQARQEGPDALKHIGALLSGSTRRGSGGARAGSPARSMDDDEPKLPPEFAVNMPAREVIAGRYALAAAVERAPRDATLRARQARFMAVCARDSAAAEDAYEHAYQLAPDNVAIVRDYALFALEHLRDAGRAEKLLSLALTLDLRNGETLRTLAAFLLRARGDLDEAENCLRLAVDLEPDNPANPIAYARFLDERRGRRDAAEAELRRAADIRPRNARALAELALFRLTRTLQVDAAEQTLGEALRLAPDDSTALLAQALLFERKGELDDAEARFRRAIEAEPQNMRAQLAYAGFLTVRRRERLAAEAQYRAAVAAAPVSAAPLSAYAAFLDQTDDPHDIAAAETHHRAALELEPFDPNVLAAYAEHLSRREGMSAEANELFTDALALSPRSSAVLRAYGRFLQDCMGDSDGAEIYLRRAVEVDPHGAEGFEELANFLHAVRRDAEEAEIYFRDALRLAPNRAETLSRFTAFLRDTRRDQQDAVRSLRKALDRNSKDAFALARHAQFLLAEGRGQEGLQVLYDGFDAAWKMDPAERPDSLMLELWLYRYAHDRARRDESLRAARRLLEADVRCEGWDMGPTVDQAIRTGHPEPELLRQLARVASTGASIEALAPWFTRRPDGKK